LRVEQEYAQTQDKARKALELQVKEIQARLEIVEAEGMKAAMRQIAKLEEKLRAVEHEINGEQRRNAEAQKNVRKCDRRVKELCFQAEEDRKNLANMQDLADKLQQKIRSRKAQIEEAVSLKQIWNILMD
jgi:myosin heavy chain 6/7